MCRLNLRSKEEDAKDLSVQEVSARNEDRRIDWTEQGSAADCDLSVLQNGK